MQSIKNISQKSSQKGLITMDATDRKILKLLQENAAQPVADIAKRVGLSVTPCWRRIQKMEEEGVIRGRVALLNAEKVGLGMSVFVAIKTDQHNDVDSLLRQTKNFATLFEISKIMQREQNMSEMFCGAWNFKYLINVS